MSTEMDTLQRLQRAGSLQALDMQLAGLAERMLGEAEYPLLLAVALASRAIGEGNACTDLLAQAGKSWAVVSGSGRGEVVCDDEGSTSAPDTGAQTDGVSTFPQWDEWRSCLESDKAKQVIGGADDQTLLVLDGPRIYLRRYWNYERCVESRLTSLARQAASDPVPEGLLKKYFPEDLQPSESSRQSVRQQREAARNAVIRRLSILSGGPGTGKTYTLARTVAMLAELHDGARFAVKIAAPTGKAAARMVESIQNAKQDLRREGISAAILDAMPESASTIHRMLGSRYQSPYFKHDTRNPLAADLVIVDEASMVDLPLMAKLLDALPEACRLMLVGDREQLASVEPGRVYGDVCHAALEGGPLAGCLTTLTESRRFPSDSAIGKVSAAIHDGGDPAWAVLMEQAQQAELNVCDSLEATQDGGAFAALVTRSLSPYLAATTPEAALSAAGQFRILCALRKGPYGVQRMNKRVEGILSKAGLRPSGRFYDHRLILVTANTPALDLNNGDVGVVLAAKNAAGLRTGGLLAWFYGKDKQPRAIPVNLLPEHETAFAMTVHKSQGSEFPNVALVLPPQGDSPVLTRELVYTGLTRVKIDRQNQTGGVTVYCSKASFTGAVDRLTERISGLFRSTSAQAAPSCRDRGGSMALGR